MAGDFRKQWQGFKKKHPEFEKNRAVKVDFGPVLDKFEKELELTVFCVSDEDNKSKAFDATLPALKHSAGGLIQLMQSKNAPPEHLKLVVKVVKRFSDGRRLAETVTDWKDMAPGLKDAGFDADRITIALAQACKAESAYDKAAAASRKQKKDLDESYKPVFVAGKSYIAVASPLKSSFPTLFKDMMDIMSGIETTYKKYAGLG